jgi:hypothetical protein
MPKNILYNVIASKTSKEKNIPRGIVLTQKRHSEGTLYFKFELPKHTGAIDEYILDDHHVSVFADMDGKRQYHYTAYMNDNEGKQFRLHIYFNPEDGYVGIPLLSSVSNDGRTFTPVADCEENHEAFKTLAKISIESLVAQLRTDHRDLIDKLKKEYDVLEKAATELSKELELNKKAYILNIDQQIAKLEELNNYTNTDPVLSHLSYLNKLKESPELQITSFKTVHLESKESKVSKDTAEPITLKEEVRKDSPSSNNRTVKKKPGLDEEIVTLKNEFEKLKNLKNRKLAKAIKVLDNSLKILEAKGVLLKDVQDLQILRTQLDGIAVKTLKLLMGTGKYPAATELAAFYPLVSDSMIQFALVQNNAVLLEFLVKQKIISSDHNDFLVKNTRYTSLVDYYFKQATAQVEAEKAKAMVACVDVLIKNSLSLMDIDSATGLPFAASLLLNPQHPLRAALELNQEKTINNPMFLKQLNTVLRIIATQPNCTKERLEQIKLLILKNLVQIAGIKNLNTLNVGVSIGQFDDEFIDSSEKALGLELRTALDIDPDVLMGRLEVEQYVGGIFPLFRSSSTDLADSIKSQYTQLTSLVNLFASSNSTYTVNDFKKQLIGVHKHTIKGLELIISLAKCDVEEADLRKVPGKKHKKQRAHLGNRKQTLLDQVYNPPSNNNDLEDSKENESSFADLMKKQIDALEARVAGAGLGVKTATTQVKVDLQSNFFGLSEKMDTPTPKDKVETKKDSKGYNG